MSTNTGHDWPLTLAGAYGRIDAYRAVLRQARVALDAAQDNIEPPRRATRVAIAQALAAIERELAVTNP